MRKIGGTPEGKQGGGGWGNTIGCFWGRALSEETLGANAGNSGVSAGFTEKADAFSAQPSSQIDLVINLRPQNSRHLHEVFLITR